MLTPDPMGGRGEGARLPRDVCDFELAPGVGASTVRIGREDPFFYVAPGGRA